MVVRLSTVLREKRESDFDKMTIMIQSHHSNVYTVYELHRVQIFKSNRWAGFLKPYTAVLSTNGVQK